MLARFQYAAQPPTEPESSGRCHLIVVSIDSTCASDTQLFSKLNDALDFPYFGWNWNALTDLLCDLWWLQEQGRRVCIFHPELPALEPESLRNYLEILLESIQDVPGYPTLCQVVFAPQLEPQVEAVLQGYRPVRGHGLLLDLVLELEEFFDCPADYLTSAELGVLAGEMQQPASCIPLVQSFWGSLEGNRIWLEWRGLSQIVLGLTLQPNRWPSLTKLYRALDRWEPQLLIIRLPQTPYYLRCRAHQVPVAYQMV